MLADGRTLSAEDVVEADVCILGAGPVGLTIARELGSDLRVCILEAGAENPAEAGVAPSGGEVDGDYPPIDETRACGFAGTAVCWNAEVRRDRWTARLGVLQPIDFEQREDVPHSGWPFGRTELEPYYARAARIFGLDPFGDDPDRWTTQPRVVPLPADGTIDTRILRYGAMSPFTVEDLDWARAAPNVTLYLHARALEIETRDSGRRAHRILAASGRGRTFHVTARAFVLALGGIENPRLLLLSNDASRGIGNEHDLVGRFFMDHPTANCRLSMSGPGAVERLALFDLLIGSKGSAIGAVGLTDETLRREHLLNSVSYIAPRPERSFRAVAAVGTLRNALRDRTMPSSLWNELRAAALGADTVAAAAYRRLVQKLPALEPTTRLWPTTQLLDTLGVGPINGWSRLPFAGRRFRLFGFHQVIEQAPEPDRRVSLSDAKDAFGRPLPRLRWFISDRELASMHRSQELLGEALARLEIGQLATTAELDRTEPEMSHISSSAHHHLGTTRMHVDPAQGVVDEHCRVHGNANLYVAGTSVFPTGGYVNPTLTALALAIRLADHLKTALPSLPEPS
jgi:choline dehydrogenase-like flavoprotein